MLLRVSGSLIPRCANSMIFSATSLVAGSSTKLRLNAEQVRSSACDIALMTSGSNAAPAKNRRIGMAQSPSTLERTTRCSRPTNKRRVKLIRSQCPFRLLFEVGAGGVFLGFFAGGGPISFVACSCGAGAPGHSGLQRFVQALDFNAVETLVPNLQPRAQGFRSA